MRLVVDSRGGVRYNNVTPENLEIGWIDSSPTSSKTSNSRRKVWICTKREFLLKQWPR